MLICHSEFDKLKQLEKNMAELNEKGSKEKLY